MAASEPNAPGILTAHFANRDRSSQGAGWSELWETGQTLWDRGKPSPALIDYIASQPSVLARSAPEGGRRPKALVPGCGRGYDVVMLALHGFDAVGLEFSEKAIEAARTYAAAELAAPSSHNFADDEDTHDARPSPGTVRFVRGDFFQKDWEASCFANGQEAHGFDLIYDYTFLCALLPEMRKDWAERMKGLLLPAGVLICLEFPLYKDLKAAGPPWGIRGVHWDLLGEGGDGIVDDTASLIHSGRGPFERLAYIKPSRSYEAGRGTDMLSVWALKR